MTCQLNFMSAQVCQQPNSFKNVLWKTEAMKYCINWEICTPYEGAARMLLYKNGK